MIENKLELLKLCYSSRLVSGFGNRVETSLVLRLIAELFREKFPEVQTPEDSHLLELFKSIGINISVNDLSLITEALKKTPLENAELEPELLERISSSLGYSLTEKKNQINSKLTAFNLCLLVLIIICYLAVRAILFPAVAKVTYFNNKNLDGNPHGTYFEPLPDVDFGLDGPKKGMPTDNFSIRYESEFEVDKPQTYKISVLSDDGVKVYLDGNVILDYWVPQDSIKHEKTIYIDKGKHNLKIEYFEGLVGAKLHFKMVSNEGDIPKFRAPK